MWRQKKGGKVYQFSKLYSEKNYKSDEKWKHIQQLE